MIKQLTYELKLSSDIFLCHGCDDFDKNKIFELRFHGHCCWANKDLEKLVKVEEGCSGYKPQMEGF